MGQAGPVVGTYWGCPSGTCTPCENPTSVQDMHPFMDVDTLWPVLQAASGLRVSGLGHFKFCVWFHRGLLLHAEIGLFWGVLHTDLLIEPTHLPIVVFPAVGQTAGQGATVVGGFSKGQVADASGILDAVEFPLTLSPTK